MITGLEPLYDVARWDPNYARLEPDPLNPAFHFNPAFGGAMEIEAAEDLYRATSDAVWDAYARGHNMVAVECGTCDGFSTAFIARAIADVEICTQNERAWERRADRRSSWSGHVWTAEISALRDGTMPFKWPQVWKDLGLDRHITTMTADTRDPATWAGLPGPVDFLLIDSEHSTATILAEWEVFRSRVRRPGGRVLFHDALLPEVDTAARMIAREMGSTIAQLNSCRGLWMLDVR